VCTRPRVGALFGLPDHVRADRESLEIIRVELRTGVVGRAKSCVPVLPRPPREGVASRRNLVDAHFNRPIISPDPTWCKRASLFSWRFSASHTINAERSEFLIDARRSPEGTRFPASSTS
jgi:hypothetical protein